MRRIPTVMASAGAAALTTLAVAVAGPAIGDDGGAGGGDVGVNPVGTAQALGACLSDHGLTGVPTGDALKPWIRQRMDASDAAFRAAMEACAPKTEVAPADQAAAEQELRSCLKDNGATVPDGATGRDLKTWILEHQSDPATAAALKACHLVVGDHPAQGGCVKPDASGEGAGKPGDAPELGDK